jgi:putative tryptophan/tyrosine transport system substrate-binding protein
MAIGLPTNLWRAEMQRREFIAGLGAAAWPVAALGQQRAIPVIGFLHAGTPNSFSSELAEGLARGLKEMGLVDGQNLAIEYSWANGQQEPLSTLVADLVRRNVAVILAGRWSVLGCCSEGRHGSCSRRR